MANGNITIRDSGEFIFLHLWLRHSCRKIQSLLLLRWGLPHLPKLIWSVIFNSGASNSVETAPPPKISKVGIVISQKSMDILSATNFYVNVSNAEIAEAERILANPPGDRMVFYDGTWILQRLEFDDPNNSVEKQWVKYPWLKVVCFKHYSFHIIVAFKSQSKIVMIFFFKSLLS